jgi:acyl-CoA synthetase (AMP-forming)/AMP-acid ligase II
MAESNVGITVWGDRVVRVDRAALEGDRVFKPLGPLAAAKGPEVQDLVSCGKPMPSVQVRTALRDIPAHLIDAHYHLLSWLPHVGSHLCSATARSQVRVVDPDSLACLPEGRVGEVWVTGPTIAGGYYNRLQEKKKSMLHVGHRPD